ncbi:MAG: hypothetical protein Q9181_003987 [Wetmoreana brouardii]
MHLSPVYLTWCITLPFCHASPLRDPILYSLLPISLPQDHYRRSLQHLASQFHKRTVTGSNPTPSGQNVSPPPQIPNPIWPVNLDDLPSSSGPFTPVKLPTGWAIWPVSTSIAIQPVVVAAAQLVLFYEHLIEYCAHRFWSSTTPDTDLVSRVIHWGAFSLTVIAGPKGPGLPWGLLALLAQGMLERARRGWTQTWQGIMVSPSNNEWGIRLEVNAELELLCDEQLSTGTNSGNDGDDEDEVNQPPPKRFCKGTDDRRMPDTAYNRRKDFAQADNSAFVPPSRPQ